MGASASLENRGETRKGEVGLVHIGKTGGNSIKHIVEQLGIPSNRFKIFGHDDTLRSILAERPRIKLGFVVRDPIERAHSGFYSRIRQGRPKNNAMWRPEEAIAYLYFDNFNALAEALSSSDERAKSAALFSLRSISHLRRDYKYHFHSVEFLRQKRKSIYNVCRIDELDDSMHGFFAPLGVAKEEVAGRQKRQHVADYPQAHRFDALSEVALCNLRKHFEPQYEIYNYILEEHCAQA